LAMLASAASMSRSAFAARFKALLGETPMEYLTRWRMETAARLLRDQEFYAVARAVGYRGDPAFTRAFTRVIGISPRSLRRQYVNRARVIVRNEEPTQRIGHHVNGSAPVAVGVGPSDDEIRRRGVGGGD
jgi:AraC-like DNA-binding protein